MVAVWSYDGTIMDAEITRSQICGYCVQKSASIVHFHHVAGFAKTVVMVSRPARILQDNAVAA